MKLFAAALLATTALGGGAALAAAYHRRADAQLAEKLAGSAPGRIRDRIAEAIWQRLQLADPELVRAGAAVMALPQNAALGARLMWETADTIWTGIGAVGAFIVGIAFLGEAMSATRILAAGLIVIGLVLMKLSSTA